MHRPIRTTIFAAIALLAAGCSGTLEGGSAGGTERRAPTGAYQGPGSAVEFVHFATQKSATDPGTWGPTLTDIEGHLPTKYGSTYYDEDRVTHGHETTHGIDSELSNNYAPKDGKRYEAFYVLENRAVFVAQPNIKKSQVAAYIPEALRGTRYNLYVVGQTAFEDDPLYLWEEWVAYTNGGTVGVELQQLGKWTQGSRDAVAGPLEMSIYAIAVARAVEKLDPQYFATNKAFREFLAWNLWRAMKVFHIGRTYKEFQFASQKTLYDALLSEAGKPIRDFITTLYGAEFSFAVFYNVSLNPEGPGSPGTPLPPGQDGGSAPSNDSGAQPSPAADAGAPKLDGPAPAPPAPQPPAGDDADGDGVADAQDVCSHTRAGEPVWKSGSWAGCASGQYSDVDDTDRDGVPNSKDACPGTPLGTQVQTSGDKAGCKIDEGGPAPTPPGPAPTPPGAPDSGMPDNGAQPPQPPPSSDVTAPQVAITSPAALEEVPLSVTVKASVSDNVGVVKVEVLIDGQLAGTLTAEPYEFNVQLAPGKREIRVVGTDAAGNQGVGNVFVTAKDTPAPPPEPPKDPPPPEPPKDPTPPTPEPPKDPAPPTPPTPTPPAPPAPAPNTPPDTGRRPIDTMGCTVAPGQAPSTLPFALAALGLLVALRRRRR